MVHKVHLSGAASRSGQPLGHLGFVADRAHIGNPFAAKQQNKMISGVLPDSLLANGANVNQYASLGATRHTLRSRRPLQVTLSHCTMPTYYSPPQTPITSLVPSSSLRPPSRSKSFSTSSSSTTGNRSSRSSRFSSSARSRDEKANGKREIPYFFLSSIAAATWVAEKYWPKGYPHGDKEDWELSDCALRARQRRLAEKTASWRSERDRRGSGRESVDGYGFANPTDVRGDGYREDNRRWMRGGYHTDDVYRRDNRGWEWARGRERRGSVIDDGWGRDRDLGERYELEPCYRRGSVTESRSAGQRYFVDGTSWNSGPVAGSGSRISSEPDRYAYGRAQPSEIEYVYGDPPRRSRRRSLY